MLANEAHDTNGSSNSKLCKLTILLKELGALGSDTLTGLLDQLKTVVDPYMGPEVHPDPLLMEKSMSLPADVEVCWRY